MSAPTPALPRFAREGVYCSLPCVSGGGLGRGGLRPWGQALMRNATTQRRARTLRNEPTDCERHLWRFLRLQQLGGFRFRRQVAVGRYIADFACIEAKLIVELDGGQHQDNDYDVQRDAELKAIGFTVLRFWNNQVLQETQAVLEEILRVLETTISEHPRKK